MGLNVTVSSERTAKKKKLSEDLSRLALDNPTITAQAAADVLGIPMKQAQRALALLRREGTVAKKEDLEIDTSSLMRISVPTPTQAATLDSAFRAWDRLKVSHNRLEADMESLRKELGFTTDTCSCCSRRGLSSNGSLWQALSALYAVGTKNIELVGKLSGELDPAAQIQAQSDSDFMVIIQVIHSASPETSKEIFRRLAELDPRRPRRLPAYPDIVAGNFPHPVLDGEGIIEGVVTEIETVEPAVGEFSY